MPKPLKSCPKCKKSPNLVTLSGCYIPNKYKLSNNYRISQTASISKLKSQIVVDAFVLAHLLHHFCGNDFSLLPLPLARSVNRFGEISTPRHDAKNLWPFWQGWCKWQHFEFTLANFICYRSNFHCWKYPKIEQKNYTSGHTASTFITGSYQGVGSLIKGVYLS